MKRHGEMARLNFVEGIVKKWDLDNHYQGAAVYYGVHQRKLLMVSWEF